jgi:hypothetical protein
MGYHRSCYSRRPLALVRFKNSFTLSLLTTESSGLLAFCLWRRKRRHHSSAAAPPRNAFSPISAPTRFSNSHPYNRFDDVASFDKSSEKVDYLDSNPSLPIISIPLSHTPPPAKESSGLLGIPSNPRLESRLSSASVYSQGTSAEDPFASSGPTGGKGRKSAFHLPNRFNNSPYAAPEPAQRSDWI